MAALIDIVPFESDFGQKSPHISVIVEAEH